jgi:hypothetical protein
MLSATALILFSALAAPAAPIADLSDAANALLAGLDADQRAIVQYEFDDEERWDWHFIPRKRPGLSFNDLRKEQYPLIQNLLKAGLSEGGFKTAETIRALEGVLRQMEGPQATHRDPLDYHVSIFGKPDKNGTWSFRYEGHHLSLHWTIVKGKAIASSPQFLGANPGDVPEGPHKGLRALGALEDLGRDFVTALDKEQRQAAIISAEAPKDILSGTERDAIAQDDLGIAYDDLSEAQQQQLFGLIEAYANIQRPEIAAQRLSRIRKADINAIKFAWMGGAERGAPHYYRVQGKTFILEYDNVQNGANHPHTTWRDFHGDFGKDLLKEHYARHKH